MTDRLAAQRERAARHRDRRRCGRVLVHLEVGCVQRQALRQLGLIAEGQHADPAAIAAAVHRFLDTAPSVVAIGLALYPEGEDEPLA